MEYLRNKHGIFTNNETTGQTAEEVYAQYLNDYFDLIDGEYVPKQIDNCLPVAKTNAELTAEIDSINSFVEELLFDILPNLNQGGEL